MSMSTLWRRVRLFINRDTAAADLQEEMRLHVEMRAEQLEQSGVNGNDAVHHAHRLFGNRTVIAEEARGASGFRWLEFIQHDLKVAVRRIYQKPAFGLSVVGVMALGLGATTAMFSAVDAAMLRPLPFANPGRLVWLRDIDVPFDPGTGVLVPPVHFPDVHDIENLRDLFSQSASYAAGGLNVSDEERPVRANAGVVTTNFFSTLGVVPVRGRVFSPEEGRPGSALVAIVSHNFWQRQLGGRDLANVTLSLNGNRHRVIGVMPKGFGFPRESALWIPMSVPTTFATFGAFRGFLPHETIARLRDGVSAGAANARLRSMWQRALEPERNSERAQERLNELSTKGALVPFQQQLIGDKSTALLMLLAATSLLLLIACANVTNLLLSQASARRREMALREVLGATRGRIIRQLLVETVLLTLAGASVGVALAPAGLHVVSRLLPPALADLAPPQVDLRVLGFATTLALITGVVFGLWPALGTSRRSPVEVIKSAGGPGATEGRLGGGRRLLVATELALTIVLLIGAGLMLRSFQHVMGLDAGLDARQVATLELSFKSMPQAERMQRLNGILATVSAAPGVAAAGAVNDLPLRGGGGIAISIVVDGAPQKDMVFARYLMASRGYFEALGIHLLAGRTFDVTDDSLSPRVAVVSASMARKYWPGMNAVGRVFRWGAGDLKPTTVIGIVADVREASLESDPDPQMYFPISQQTPSNVAIVARGTLPPAKLLGLLANAVRIADRTQAVYNVKMMEDVVDASVAPRRTNMMLIVIFAGVALVLSALGVYAVVGYGVAQRSRELGIRSALGASAANLVALVAGELAWVAVAGVTVGLGGAWALSKLVSTMLFGISPHDPATYVAVPLAVLLPAAIAALIPAHRASQVDPTVVLRED
jgi:predicted permease